MMVMPDAVRAAGFVYRRAVEARPKRVVLFGIWIHFFPGLVANALVLLAILGGSIEGYQDLQASSWRLLALPSVPVCFTESREITSRCRRQNRMKLPPNSCNEPPPRRISMESTPDRAATSLGAPFAYIKQL